MHSIIVTSAIIISTFHHRHPPLAWAQLQEVAPPQLSNKGVQTLQSLQRSERRIQNMEEGLQSLQRSERRIQNMEEGSFYLPGLGGIKDYVPQQLRPARSKSKASSSSHPRISPQRFRGEDSKLTFSSAQPISPVSVTVSDSSPPRQGEL